MSAVISRQELHAAINDARMTVVDALPSAPFGQRHLPHAVNVVAAHSDEQVRAAPPDPAAAIVTYSTDQHCTRGPELADRRRTLGYHHVRTYYGGIEDWIAAGLPVERPRSVTLTLAELALGPTAALFEGHRRAGHPPRP